jgi:uncharacterized membrane protein
MSNTVALPPQVWAIIIASLGVLCAIMGYVLPGDVVSRQSMFTIANSLISGALGAFAGHASATSNSTGPNATINNPGATFPGDANK